MKTRSFFTLLAFGLLSGAAFAGFTQSVPVVVDLDGQFAAGNQTTARTSANDLEYIGCGTRNTSDGVFSFRFGFCQAGDANGVEVLCFTEDPALIDEMRSNSSYSFITFGWREGSGGLGDYECIRVGFSTQSFYLPNKKAK